MDFAERSKELDFEQRHRLHGGLRAVLSLGLLRAAWQRLLTPTLPAPTSPVARPAAGTLALTFVGHGTVMLTTPSVRLLIDPLLENWLGGLRRARAAALDPRDRDEVELVLLSGRGRDRLSPRSLAELPRAATVVVPPGCGPALAPLRFARVIELGDGRAFSFGDIEITAARLDGPAAAGRRTSTSAPAPARARAAPMQTGYVLRGAGRTIYYAGEAGYGAAFAAVGRRFSPDVALLPIAGYQPASFRRRHLSPLDAVYAFEDLGARLLIPVAYGSFALSYEPLDEPLAWLRSAIDERGLAAALTVLQHGQTCLLR